MSTRLRRLSILTAACLVGGVAVTRVLAHPPDAPYDNTIFAPIADEAGIPIGLTLTARGSPPRSRANRPRARPDACTWSIRPASCGRSSCRPEQDGHAGRTSRLVTLGVVGPGQLRRTRLPRGGLPPELRAATASSTPTPPSPTAGTADLPDHAAGGHHRRSPERGGGVAPPTAPATRPRASTSSRRELMRIDWPQFNHDAGDITFGPDGKLYIPTGDGGGADDEDGDQSITPPPGVSATAADGNAQKLTVALGKILRIDVDGNNSANGQYGIPSDNPSSSTPGAVKEIWAYGLRNPFRLSFDTDSGMLTSATSARTTSRRSISSSRAATTAGTSRRARCSSSATAPSPASPQRLLHRPPAHRADRSGRAVRHPPRGALGDRRVRLSRQRDPGAQGTLRVRRVVAAVRLPQRARQLRAALLSGDEGEGSGLRHVGRTSRRCSNFPEACAALGLTDPIGAAEGLRPEPVRAGLRPGLGRRGLHPRQPDRPPVRHRRGDGQDRPLTVTVSWPPGPGW